MADCQEIIRTSGVDAPRRRGVALAELHKALKAMGFYPPEHPLRGESLRTAFRSLGDAMDGEPLALTVGKGGFTTADGAAPVQDAPLVQALARELFIRRVRRLTFLPELSFDDLEAFLDLLSIDHRSVPLAGGMEPLMVERGIASIWANEIDLSVIYRKRQEAEEALAASSGMPPAQGGADADPPSADAGAGGSAPSPSPEASDADVSGEPETIIGLMAREPDDDRYRDLARNFEKGCERLQSGGEFERILPLLVLLLQQANSGGASPGRRETGLRALQRVAGDGMLDFLVRRLEKGGGGEENGALVILAALGAGAVERLLARLDRAEGVRAHRNLAAGLVAVGDEGVPLLLARLRDERPSVVQTVAEVVGEIGHSGCVPQLCRCLGHRDERVRREALRSIARIGGPEAEDALIAQLGPLGDPLLRRQVVISLGAIRSSRALQPLLAVVTERDHFLRSLPLKKDALAALGRIGDRGAVPLLLELLERRPWLCRGRWEELRCLAATVLGQLGDDAALPLLAEFSGESGPLGAACRGAVDAILNQNGASHG